MRRGTLCPVRGAAERTDLRFQRCVVCMRTRLWLRPERAWGSPGPAASAGGTKPATLETGAVINVPLFINIGTHAARAHGARRRRWRCPVLAAPCVTDVASLLIPLSAGDNLSVDTAKGDYLARVAS